MKHDVCIVGGCGHVGLPLAITFAEAGLNTLILDKNEKALDNVLSGRMPFLEKDAPEKLKKVLKEKMLSGTTNNSAVSESKYVIIIIGTPIDEFLNPKVQNIQNVFEDLIPYFKAGQTIILRSTIYPGTTRAMHKLLIKRKNEQLPKGISVNIEGGVVNVRDGNPLPFELIAQFE